MKDKRKVIIAAVCVLCIICIIAVVCVIKGRQPNEEAEEYRSIKISDISGTVQVTRTGTGSIDAYSGMMLQSEDVIETGEESYLYLKLDDDKYVMLEPDSKARIVATGTKQDSKTGIFLEKGAIVNRLDTDLSDDSVYEVNTPNSTMAVRGTNFRIVLKYDENGRPYTDIEVFEGEVSCKPEDNSGKNKNNSDTTQSKSDEIYCKPGNTVRITDVKGSSSFGTSTGTLDYDSLPLETLNFLKELVKSGVSISISESELDAIIEQKENETTTEEESTTEEETTQRRQNIVTTTKPATTKPTTTKPTTTKPTTTQPTTTKPTTTTTKPTTTEEVTEKEAPTDEIPSGSDSLDSI